MEQGEGKERRVDLVERCAEVRAHTHTHMTDIQRTEQRVWLLVMGQNLQCAHEKVQSAFQISQPPVHKPEPFISNGKEEAEGETG